MLKSAYKFGLYLMASLTVLSTVATVSIGNTNLFENAMASEKYSNKYENSNGYANYESYGANYYQQPNYYYTQDRQYEDKQNSYTNDYNYNDKYNKYPTKENNYECRTGPFEGFFVSSVEFCKSDNRKDNGYDDSDKNLQIFPANKVAELGDRWWQWAASLNVEENPNPFTETGQEGCDVGLQENGKLLFLVGTSKNFTTYPDNGFPVHKCEIKKGTQILFPIVNTICDTLEVNTPFFGANETAQRICANNLANTAFDLHANIDGFEVKNPEQYRVDSPAGGFTLNAVENNPVGIPAGNGTAVQDGFWILLKPLKPGEHVISFSGAFDFRQVPGLGVILEYGATYLLDIQPSEKSYYPDDYHQQNYQMN
jgi:hypothetical protein